MRHEPLHALLQRLMRDRLGGSAASLDLFVSAWELLVGPEMAARTRPIALSGDHLHVAVASSAWHHELAMRSEDVLQRIEGWLPDQIRGLDFVVRPAQFQPPEAPHRAAAPVGALSEGDEAALALVEDPLLRAHIRRARALARGRDENSNP